MSLMREVAIDCGNLNVKSKSDLGELIYPNSIREANKHEGKSAFGSFVKNSVEVYDYKNSDTNETERLIVGQIDEDARYSLDTNVTRYNTPDFKKSFAIAAFKHVHFENEKIKVVTGVTGNQFEDESVYESIQSLVGEYEINRVKFEIAEIEIQLQPLATTIYIAFNYDGSLRNGAEELMNSKIVVIDLGMGSTDVTTIINGHIHGEPFELSTSMFDAYNAIIREMKELKNDKGDYTILKRTTLKAQEVEKQIREALEENKNKIEYITTNNERFDITKIVNDVFEWTTNKILQDLRGNKINFEEYSNVIFTGGGARTLLNNLRVSLMAYKGNSKVKIKLPDDLTKANVRGYYVVAKNPEIFKTTV